MLTMKLITVYLSIMCPRMSKLFHLYAYIVTDSKNRRVTPGTPIYMQLIQVQPYRIQKIRQIDKHGHAESSCITNFVGANNNSGGGGIKKFVK